MHRPARHFATATVVASMLLALLAGCAPSGTEPAPGGTPVTEPGSGAAAETPAPLETPPTLGGEVARATVDGATVVTSTGREAAVLGTRYLVQVQCVATEDAGVTYAVEVEQTQVTKGEAACDGDVHVSSVGDGTLEGAVAVVFEGDLHGVTSAYAIVVPEG